MAKYVFEPEIASAGVNYVVPSYASIDEAYFYLQEATEENWNNFTRDLGIYELGVLEATGSEVVYEAESEAAAKKAAGLGNVIKKALESFKGWIENVLQTIQKKINEAKARITGNVVAKVKKNLENGRLAAKNKKGEDVVYAKAYYEFNNLDSYRSDEGSKTFSDSLKPKSVDKLTGVESGSKEAISIDELRGTKVEEVKRDYIVSHIDNIVKYALDFQFTKKSIVGPYNELKKDYDKLLKAAKGNDADLSKVKAKLTLLNKNASTVVKAFHERQSQNLALLLKVAVGTLGKSEKEKVAAKAEKNAKKEEKTNESAVISASYTSEIEKLFDWNF